MSVLVLPDSGLAERVAELEDLVERLVGVQARLVEAVDRLTPPAIPAAAAPTRPVLRVVVGGLQ